MILPVEIIHLKTVRKEGNNMINAILLMLVLGALLGLGLGIADKVLKVEVDERIETVTSMLPGYNCGGCGFAGCAGLASGLVEGTVTQVSRCKPCKEDRRKEICDYLNETPGPTGECVKVTA